MIVSLLNRHKRLLGALGISGLAATSILQLFKPSAAISPRMMQDFGGVFQFQEWPQFLVVLTNFILASITIFLVNRTCQNLRFLPSISNMPMLSGALLFASIDAEFNTPVLWGIAILTIAIVHSSHSLFEAQKVRGHVFQASASASIIIQLDVHCLFIALLPMLMLVASGKLNFRNAIISMIGLITPLYFSIALEYLINPPIALSPFPKFTTPLFDTLSSMLSLGLMVILIIVGLASKIGEGAVSLAKRQWLMLLFLLQFTLITSILFGRPQLTFALLFVPGCVVFSRFFVSNANIWFKDVVIIMLCTAAVINQFTWAHL